MSVRETRKLVIRDVVVSPDDIRNLAQVVFELSKEMDDDTVFALDLGAFDNSEYEGASPELFGEGGLLDTRQIRKVGMYASSRRGEAEIVVHLYHEVENYSLSDIRVAGYSSTWVNGAIARLQQAVDNWQRQPSWPRRLRWVFVLLGAFAIGRIYGWLTDLFLDHVVHVQPVAPRPGWVETIRPFVWYIDRTLDVAVGLAPSGLLVSKLIKLWPRVELATGKEYARSASRRRAFAWGIFSLAVLPVLLSALYEGVKYLLAH